MANASIRYGATIRKRYQKIKQEKQALYHCEVCGRDAVKRKNTSIWECKHCKTVYAGGAYTMTTPAGSAAKRLIDGIKS